ncbi:hypothetical protein IFM89_009821 [Coptis chinensis]|uniref:Separase-like TPR repeats region domain-containing protein n=1 Tax=Coptis chinensis TaxID=261450 RepID=A0A835LUY7_9MAGN|nr:hypothetical protein IFM89_009821 [Coptis chinensis]
MVSVSDSSLLTRLENHDYGNLGCDFAEYLQPFSDFTTFDFDLYTTKKLKTKKNRKTTKKKNSDDKELTIRLAKRLTGINHVERKMKRYHWANNHNRGPRNLGLGGSGSY